MVKVMKKWVVVWECRRTHFSYEVEWGGTVLYMPHRKRRKNPSSPVLDYLKYPLL
jgi:hypothetical protein